MEKARLDLAPIAQGSLSQRAYSVLRDGLISGQFRPGQRLVMQELADMLGTSITPVREACMRLVSEGGLQLRSGRFAIVPPMTLERYMEVRLMRLELEGLAAEIAAQKATPEDIANLRAIHPEYAAADDNEQPDEAFRLNRDFHFAVYRISGMEMLVSHIESLWTSMGPMLTVFFIRGKRTYFGAQAHQRVIERLEAGDGPGARDAIRRDIIDGGVDFIRFLKENVEFSIE
ncbi:MAG: GntR family transcriptional regulator [Paracoccus sp. (in: a-proteobacteria)]|jgi:GntR family colanic acid and biofilm gene transcriptional regulator